ncbi:MAG: sulfurtransferase [Pirellula sp.]
MSTTSTETIVNIAAYKFVRWTDLETKRDELKSLCKRLNLRGTILLSGEGINLFLAGARDSIDTLLSRARALPELADLQVKESLTDYQPFNRMLVKIKREIIPVGLDQVEPVEGAAPKISPSELKHWLDEGRPITMLDTRNDYEVQLGTFENAIDLNIRNFRQFPKAAASLPDEIKNQPVVMFCTGGIRCEKIGPYMKGLGFQEIYQLDGGILKYFEQCQHAHYHGDCFVFDQRVAVEPSLNQSDNGECFACKHSLTPSELLSDMYVPAKSCPYCYQTPEERLRSLIAKRQARIIAIACEQRGSTPYVNKRWISIPQRCAGMPLVDALGEFYPGYSREQWLAAIDSGEIGAPVAIGTSLQTRPPHPTQPVREGERFLHSVPNYVEPKINPDIYLVHEDAAIVVVDKSAPLPMHPSGRFNLNSLESILMAAYHPEKIRPAHRLDANTTGVVVFVRKFKYSHFLQSQFTEGQVIKRYMATVTGHPVWQELTCELPISRLPLRHGGRTIDPHGQSARTEFQVLERLADGTSVIQARPSTGRTHQIRLHLASMGFPIVNDPLYGPGGMIREPSDCSLQDQPMGLHAEWLSLVHPLTKRRVEFESVRKR